MRTDTGRRPRRHRSKRSGLERVRLLKRQLFAIDNLLPVGRGARQCSVRRPARGGTVPGRYQRVGDTRRQLSPRCASRAQIGVHKQDTQTAHSMETRLSQRTWATGAKFSLLYSLRWGSPNEHGRTPSGTRFGIGRKVQVTGKMLARAVCSAEG